MQPGAHDPKRQNGYWGTQGALDTPGSVGWWSRDPLYPITGRGKTPDLFRAGIMCGHSNAEESDERGSITIKVDQTQAVTGLLLVPARAFACYVLAHGAGAGMTHPFMAAVGKGLHERGMATLRYQFPPMEKGLRHPDRPPAAHATVRAAVAAAAHLAPTVPLIAGANRLALA
jgi:hypothetical protein